MTSIEREKILLQSLHEADLRAFQLEKTIKWWSESTANWREKWGCLRSERNKLRSDIIVLQGQYKSLTEEYAKVKQERNLLKTEVDTFEAAIKSSSRSECIHCSMLKKNDLHNNDISLDDSTFDGVKVPTNPESLNSECEKYRLPPEKIDTLFSIEEETIVNMVPVLQEELESLQDYVSNLTDVSSKNITVNFERKNTYLPTNLQQIKNESLYEKLEKIKLYIKQCQTQIQAKDRQIAKLQNTVQSCDEFKSRSTTQDRTASVGARMLDLQQEIYRLQQQNYVEWTKREQCQTEIGELKRKLNLSTLKMENMEEELTRRTKELSETESTHIEFLRGDVKQKTRCLLETKECLIQTRNRLAEKRKDLVHEKKRTEHYEEEVTRLRKRIEDLKEQVLHSEDKVDLQGNTIKRLQRTLEDRTQDNEILKVHLTHLGNRLKRENAIDHSSVMNGDD